MVGPGPPVAFRHCAGGCPLPDPPVTFPLEGSLPCPFFLLKGSCWVGPHPLTPLTLLKAPPPNTVKLEGWRFTLWISGTQSVHSTLSPLLSDTARWEGKPDRSLLELSRPQLAAALSGGRGAQEEPGVQPPALCLVKFYRHRPS